MAILTGFPPSNRIWHCVRITDKDFPSGPEPSIKTSLPSTVITTNRDLVSLAYDPCPTFRQHLRKQNERVRAALVVYALNVMEEIGFESTPQAMQDCIDVGEEMYARYKFEKHGPYGDYIQGHFKKLLQEKDYYAKVVSNTLFG